MLSAILNKSVVDLNETSISRASVHRKGFQVLDRQRDKMRQETIETLKGKQLILHFDGKIVEQQQEMCEGGMMVDCGRIAVSVRSPQFGDNGDLLLGVVLSDSSKGSDQAYNILSLLEYYEICDQIFAIILCCDTTSSNTCVHNGTVQILFTT